MINNKVILVYNGIEKIVKIPQTYSELEDIFLREFKEDKNKKFSFSYMENIAKNNDNDFSKLIQEIKKKSKPIINVSLANENINNEFKLSQNYEVLDLIEDSYAHSKSCLDRLDNTFTTFKSTDDIYYIVYADRNKSIISYDLIDNKKINEIKKAHNNYITNFRYYFDKTNKRDLMISISNKDSNVKIWNINNWSCINDIQNAYNSSLLLSACFLKDNNEIFIATSSYAESIIKVFALNGTKKIINFTHNNIFMIDNFYDKKLNSNFLVIGCEGIVESFDYNKNCEYKIYSNKDNAAHYNFIINYREEIVQLIESNSDGLIKIWDFHSAKLLMKINVDSIRLYGFCLWNKKYLFVGCLDESIKLIDIENGNIIQTLYGQESIPLTIKKINLPKYGEALISQGNIDDPIKIWVNLNEHN